jgi:hypothetical protein
VTATPWGREPTGIGVGADTLSVNTQVPLSPEVSESVPDAEYTPSAALVGEFTAPVPLTPTSADAAVVTKVTGPLLPVTANWPE